MWLGVNKILIQVCVSVSVEVHISHAYEIRIFSGCHCLQGQSKYFVSSVPGKKGKNTCP